MSTKPEAIQATPKPADKGYSDKTAEDLQKDLEDNKRGRRSSFLTQDQRLGSGNNNSFLGAGSNDK